MKNFLKNITENVIGLSALDLFIFMILAPILQFYIPNTWIFVLIIFLCFAGSTVLENVVRRK